MRRDEEGEEVLVVLVDVPAEEAREDDAVPEARDREQLGDALQQPENDRLRVRDQVGEDHVSAVERFGPVWNQAKAKQARPTRNAAMPCLTWWWPDPASWPGKKLGSELAGSVQ